MAALVSAKSRIAWTSEGLDDWMASAELRPAMSANVTPARPQNDEDRVDGDEQVLYYSEYSE